MKRKRRYDKINFDHSMANKNASIYLIKNLRCEKFVSTNVDQDAPCRVANRQENGTISTFSTGRQNSQKSKRSAGNTYKNKQLISDQ